MDERLFLGVGIALALLLVAGVILSARRRRSKQLAQRFGSEYTRAVEEHGGKRKAEAELASREKRFEKAHVRALADVDRERYRTLWAGVQSRFVDAPAAAVAEGDQLIEEVMRARGYPLGDPAQRLADVALAHPQLLEHYRSACTLAAETRAGNAGTEDLRQAMIHYRELFEDLLEARQEELVGASA